LLAPVLVLLAEQRKRMEDPSDRQEEERKNVVGRT
jgi:hypothetical protein